MVFWVLSEVRTYFFVVFHRLWATLFHLLGEAKTRTLRAHNNIAFMLAKRTIKTSFPPYTMQKNLFGQALEQQPQRFPVSTIGTARHRKCTYEEKSILASALIKFLRLGAEKEAITVFWKMKVVGVSDSYIVHRLCAFAWEDSNSVEALTYATALRTTWQDDPDNAMTRTILALCRLPRFWMSRQGAEDETMRIRVRESVKEQAKRSKLVIDDFPEWVRDRFTMQGRDLAKAGVKISERFSGVCRGGNNLRAETLLYGAPSPDKPSLFDTDVVRESAEAHQSVDQWLEEKGMTVEEWRNSIQKPIN